MPARVHTAVVVRAVYQPAGGAERTIMPPTYPVSNGDRDPDARYLMDSRLVDGEHACWWRGFGRRRTAGGIERPWSGAQPQLPDLGEHPLPPDPAPMFPTGRHVVGVMLTYLPRSWP
jgi:hypothetical protein